MSLLSEAFQALKNAMTGEAVVELETPANNGLMTVLVRVKKKGSGEPYVVLARGRAFDGSEGEGNSNISISFSKSDWEQFAAVVGAVQDYLTQHSGKSKE